MRTRLSITSLASLVLLFLLLPAARADVTMTFVGAPSGASHGVYISPYTIAIDGVNALLVCDDFHDEVGPGYPSWQARVIWGGDDTALGIGSTRMAYLSGKTGEALQHLYDMKAWLEIHMDDTNRDVYTWAVWYLFQPTEVDTWLDDYYPQDQAFQDAVHGAAAWRGDASGLRGSLIIYSPTDHYDQMLNKWPQEFNRVVPDGGVTLILLGAALVGLETLRRRFRA